MLTTVLAAVAAQVGRSGKRLEPGLWQEWGGSPTLRRLRYHGAADAGVIRRLHQRIEAVLGDPMPTAAEEQANPAAADARYEEATRRLIGLTRNRKQFGLLFAEPRRLVRDPLEQVGYKRRADRPVGRTDLLLGCLCFTAVAIALVLEVAGLAVAAEIQPRPKAPPPPAPRLTVAESKLSAGGRSA